MIKKSGSRWVVYTKDGKRKLATCFSREEAVEEMEELKRSGELYAKEVKLQEDFE